MKRALIISGGWEGHYPEKITRIFEQMIEVEGFEVDITNSLHSIHNAYPLNAYQLIIPNWTMGQIPFDSMSAILEAVQNGTGIAGVHGGMGDAFRNETEYQFMVGGQFVAHPGGQDVEYTVVIKDEEHVVTKGVNDFDIKSELYYMHIDPSIQVLAATKTNQIDMPVAWTKTYGKGKVFYCSIGHKPEDLMNKDCWTLIKNGLLWASANG
ncbi:ThuA domain-containing protein [Neobacillus drentensis]|uniref:ThuA domain-containing protein n=1 Tax=Neobacillus drentensis TaxID=220684 RepID=UPI002FFE1803